MKNKIIVGLLLFFIVNLSFLATTLGEEQNLNQEEISVAEEIPTPKLDSEEEATAEIPLPPDDTSSEMEENINKRKIERDNLTWTEVTTSNELIYAIQRNENVVLMNDIILEKGVELFDGFHLSGKDPVTGVVHTLVTKGISDTDTFHVKKKELEGSSFYIKDVHIKNSNERSPFPVASTLYGVKQYMESVTYESNNAMAFFGDHLDVYVSGNSDYRVICEDDRSSYFSGIPRLHISGKARFEHKTPIQRNHGRAFMYLTMYERTGMFIEKNADVAITLSSNLYLGAKIEDNRLVVGDYAHLDLKMGEKYLDHYRSTKTGYDIGENAKVRIEDGSEYGSKEINEAFLPVNKGGEFIARRNSQIEILSKRFSDVIKSDSKDSRVIFDEVEYGNLMNYRKSGQIFGLTANPTGNLEIVNQTIKKYSYLQWQQPFQQWHNVKAVVNYDGRSPHIVTSTNEKFTNEFVVNTPYNKIEFHKVKEIPLTVDEVTDNSDIISGLSDPNMDIMLTVKNSDDSDSTYQAKTNQEGKFTVSLDKRLKPLSMVEVVSNYQDEETKVTVEIKVRDVNPPTGKALLQIVDENQLGTFDFSNSVGELHDGSGEIQKTVNSSHLKKEVGLQFIEVSLKDSSENENIFNVPVFITNSTTEVRQKDAYSGVMVSVPLLEWYPEDVFGNIEKLLMENNRIKAWNEQGEINKSEFKIQQTNLEAYPLPGNYQVEYVYQDLSLVQKVLIKNKDEFIDITVPKKVLFGSVDGMESKIISPKYKIRNNSEHSVEVKVKRLEKTSTDPFELLALGETKVGAAARLKMRTDHKEITLTEAISDEFVGAIHGMSELLFQLNGTYLGDYLETIQPTYDLELQFKAK